MARKNKHKSGGNPNRPRFWGRHAVAAALDNPERRVLKAWATREAASFMQFPEDVAVTLAEAPDRGRLVPADAPHQGVVIEVEPLDETWLDFDHDALVRSIIRHEAAEVGRFGKGDRDVLRELHEPGRLASCPGAQDPAVRIIERCRDGMLAPESRPVRCAVALV